MRVLLLLRHAKAAREASEGGDEARPLNERGRSAATAMGRWLAGETKFHPDLVLASSAHRTRETWDAVAAELPARISVRFQRSLYLAPHDAMLAVIRGAPPDAARLMIVGHNPGIHELARQLIGRIGARTAARLAFDRMREKFPTGALAVVAFPKAQIWADVHFGEGRFESFVRPKDIR
jgi:phosphohistidine phosphatase